MPIDEAFLESLRVRAIGRDVDTSGFSCEKNIDWYVKNAACDHHEKRIAAVHCFMHGAEVAGYVTTSMADIKFNDKKLRDGLGLGGILLREGGSLRERFPALLIGMLGVSTAFQRKGLGERMVMHAIGLASTLSDGAGCRLVVVDSDKTDRALALYRKLNFREVQVRDTTVQMLYDLGPRQS